MTEIHIHIHGQPDGIELPAQVGTFEQFGPPADDLTVDRAEAQAWERRYYELLDLAEKSREPELLLWERVGEIRTLQIEDLDADELTRERRQSWVAGILQSIETIRHGEIRDVSDKIWKECGERFPFPNQKTDLGTLADYRDVKPGFIKERDELVPAEFRQVTRERTISPVEALADPELRHLVHVEDATGEEPDAIVSFEMFDTATEQVSDT